MSTTSQEEGRPREAGMLSPFERKTALIREVQNGSTGADNNATGIAFWAYVSLTNNDTQHVTLVTPQ